MDILEILRPYENLIQGHFEDIKVKLKDHEKDVENAKDTERLLRIGVVGQVKAGKSSLLNALLFEGEYVLPKAATPMTAALTIIKYAEEFKAEIQFYSKEDWIDIEQTYEAYKKRYMETKSLLEQEQLSGGGLFGREAIVREIGDKEILLKSAMPEEWKAAEELIRMVSDNYIDVYEFLDTTETILNLENLQQYVGAGGKYTPIVRNVTLYYNYPTLKDIEIVDTPGINDPIVSRGRATKGFLGQCDVVFMLSKCSHFMDMSDLQLLAQYLPEKGIKDIVLIGSQFDGEFKGEKHKSKDIFSLIGRLGRVLNESSRNTFEELKDQCKSEEEREIMQRLIQALPPVFVSSIAYSIAKHLPDLSEDEKFYLDGYNNLYKGFEFNKELLLELSNMSSVTKKLEEQTDKKEVILKGRLNELIDGINKGLRIKLHKILQETTSRIARLKTEDVDSLKMKEKDMVTRISNGRNKVEGSFESVIYKMQSDMALLKTEVKGMSLNFAGFQVQSESNTESYDVTVTKKFLWVIPYSSTETRYRTVTYRYADTHDAITKVEEFVYEAQKAVQQAIMRIINVNELKARVKEGAISLFDLNDTDFEPEDILLPLDRVISKITIPDVDIDKQDFITTISKQFSGRVSENSIDKLREAQKNALKEVEREVDRLVTAKTKEISSQLEAQCNDFVDNLIKDIQEDLGNLREELKDRENIIKRYEDLKNTLAKISI